MSQQEQITVVVDTIIIKVLIPSDLYQTFLSGFRANSDDRFVCSNSGSTDENGTTRFFIELKSINRVACYDYLENLCQKIGLSLIKKDHG